MKHNSIKSLWLDLSNSLFEGEMGRIQIIESKKMFYSGFSACLNTLYGLSDIDEDDAAKELQKLNDEAKEYFDKGIFEDDEKYG